MNEHRERARDVPEAGDVTDGDRESDGGFTYGSDLGLTYGPLAGPIIWAGRDVAGRSEHKPTKP